MCRRGPPASPAPRRTRRGAGGGGGGGAEDVQSRPVGGLDVQEFQSKEGVEKEVKQTDENQLSTDSRGQKEKKMSNHFGTNLGVKLAAPAAKLNEKQEEANAPALAAG